ncbi:MAG: Lipopolysaccharide core biosynthesis protein WaaP, heptosyl-I-kinase, partial [Phycisphaerales bacterium]|nr:Lipopolysaccharide core biosynthesis protein WaaP, heptosyl-I-kinase [Phycisphaerales bacterium]
MKHVGRIAEVTAKNHLHAAAEYQPIFRQVGLDAEAVFTHPQIVPWRRLPDRENCTLDAPLEDGRRVRLHVKRYAPSRRPTTPAEDEVAGHRLLMAHGIPTAPLAGWGVLEDRRSFVMFEDLTGYKPADKLIESDTSFDRLSQATADLAARLHHAGLHHRDLYLCHFMAKADGDETDVKLIDPARVRRLPGFLTRGRWIVKDLAQFWYSTLSLPITDDQRKTWINRYVQQ